MEDVPQCLDCGNSVIGPGETMYKEKLVEVAKRRYCNSCYWKRRGGPLTLDEFLYWELFVANKPK